MSSNANGSGVPQLKKLMCACAFVVAGATAACANQRTPAESATAESTTQHRTGSSDAASRNVSADPARTATPRPDKAVTPRPNTATPRADTARAATSSGDTATTTPAPAATGSEPAAEATSGSANAQEPIQVIRGKATYYASSFAGQETASGETYDPQEMTAATKDLPLGSVVRVVRRDTGHSVEVRVNDRLPRRMGATIDLSRAAAEELEMIHEGIVPVRVEVLDMPSERPTTESAGSSAPGSTP